MKRTALKRGKPLKRKTPIKFGQPLARSTVDKKPRKPLSPKSPKRTAEQQERLWVVFQAMVRDGRQCMAAVRGLDHECRGGLVGHEVCKRSQLPGGHLIVENVLIVCEHANSLIETEPRDEMKRLGLVMSRADWDAGVRTTAPDWVPEPLPDRQTCPTGKVCYLTKKAARDFAHRYATASSNRRPAPYHCEACGHWHTTIHGRNDDDEPRRRAKRARQAPPDSDLAGDGVDRGVGHRRSDRRGRSPRTPDRPPDAP